MMRICANQISAFDVDDTLVYLDSQENIDPVEVFCFNQKTLVYPNHKIINQLKKEFQEKKFIIVWSQQGDEWSDAVVRALKLDNYVHLAMTKISKAYDDLPISEWMKRVKA